MADVERMRTVLPRALDFAIVGAPKSGTSSLSSYFNSHPGAHVLEPKDAHFFRFLDSTPTFAGPDAHIVNDKVLSARPSYQEQLERIPATCLVGEANAGSMYDEATLLRLDEALAPTAPVFVCLRRPDRRAFSAYLHTCRDGHETLSFHEALDQEDLRVAEGWRELWWYRRLGFYTDHVERLFDIFGRSRVRVLLFEDLTAPGSREPARALEALGLPPSATSLPHRNRSGVFRHDTMKSMIRHPLVRRVGRLTLPLALRRSVSRRFLKVALQPAQIPSEQQSELIDSFTPDIERLGLLLERDLSPWTERTPAR